MKKRYNYMKDKKFKRDEPRTHRGRDVRQSVYDAAEKLLQERWLGDISVVGLAKEAGIARASLLFQFPKGWFDIAWDLVGVVIGNPFEDALNALYNEPSRPKSPEAIASLMETFIDVADGKGRLVPNLRSQMFVWGEEHGSQWRIPAQDWVEEISDLMVADKKDITDEHRTVAESLTQFALDLAGRGGFYLYRTENKRERIRQSVVVALAGLERTAVA